MGRDTETIRHSKIIRKDDIAAESKQIKADQSRGEQSRAEQSRAEQSRAELA